MSGPLAGVKILVVDDQACVRRLVKLILARGGAEVIEVATVEAAIAALGSFRPQLLISDINMPIEDGYALMRRIRALDGWGTRLPAIALTGGGGVASHMEAQRAGFSAYLTKPFLPSTLVDAAVSVLAMPR